MATLDSATFTISFRVICIHPPLGERDGQPTVFGLQDKKGGLEMGVRQDDGLLIYTDDNCTPKSL
jgi:hypothetical protein